MSPTPSAQRLRHGLPGYLILFAPHAFASQRQLQAREPLSPPVFLHISTHFTATHGIPLSPLALKLNSFQSVLWLSRHRVPPIQQPDEVVYHLRQQWPSLLPNSCVQDFVLSSSLLQIFLSNHAQY